VIVKGAPETVLERCTTVDPGVHGLLEREFAAGKPGDRGRP